MLAALCVFTLMTALYIVYIVKLICLIADHALPNGLRHPGWGRNIAEAKNNLVRARETVAPRVSKITLRVRALARPFLTVTL